MALPTNRTAANTIEEHTADHNTLAAQHNELEGHADATTDVHGIADISVLALSSHDHDSDYEPIGAAAAAAAALVDAAPATLDTLNELAAALGDDANFATTVTTALAGKSATGHDHTGTYEPAGTVATHEADTTSVHGIADTSALALTSHTHSGAYVALPASGPTSADQILGLSDDDPLTTAWIDAPSGGGTVPGEYGDGSDGVVNFDGSTTVLGLAPSSGKYTLTRDIFLADGSQVSGTAVLYVANFRVFCTGTFTVGASATLHGDGAAASGTTGGGNVSTAGTTGANVGGSNGNAGAAGTGGGSLSRHLGATGGAGGGSSGGPGTGGGVSASSATIAAGDGTPHTLVSAYRSAGSTTSQWNGGGGGSSGSAAASSTGGGGGAGGLPVTLTIYNLVVNGTLRAAGGAGGAATGSGTGAGGGGGGGGGGLVLVYHTKSGTGSTFTAATNTPGGSGGAPQGAGKTGAAGSNGKIYEIVH